MEPLTLCSEYPIADEVLHAAGGDFAKRSIPGRTRPNDIDWRIHSIRTMFISHEGVLATTKPKSRRFAELPSLDVDSP